jgi:hypothetical protein
VQQTNNNKYILIDTISTVIMMNELAQKEFIFFKSSITENSILVMPYCYRNHWYLCLADIKQATFKSLNPYRPNSINIDTAVIKKQPTKTDKVEDNNKKKQIETDTDRLNHFLKFLQEYDNLNEKNYSNKNWEVVAESHDLPIQTGSTNCGVLIVMYFDILFRSKSKRNLCDYDPNKCRVLYQEELLKTSKNMKNLCLVCATAEGPEKWVQCSSCKRWICFNCYCSIYSTPIQQLQTKKSLFECILCEQL